jgi:tetratricopeptide (TPR) repeat protein
MADSQMTATPDEGELGPTSVPQLLAEAWRDRRSGWLQLARGKCERRIRVQDGAPISIESSLADDVFAETLEERGLITTEERTKVEGFARDRECPQASAVLALRLLDANDLYKAMRIATRNQLGETFEWQSGAYQWMQPSDAAESPGKPHDILNLFQEQLPQRWGSERLFQTLMSFSECYGDISPRFRRVADKLARAGEHAEKAITRLDGNVSLGQVLGESAGDPLAAATLWILVHTGILRMSDDRRSREADAVEMEFEVEVEHAATPNAEAAKTLSPAGQPAEAAKTSEKSEALRVEIQSFLGELQNLDHYAALGLPVEANPVKIKRAYFKAAKKFHPDALARQGLEDLRDDAARVFARITEAFETLSNASKKAAYDAGTSTEPEIDTARLAQAETSFRKGEILVKMGNFDGALEYLESAVDLWSEEPAYQAALGWALYKQHRSDAARARQHLEIAHGQASDNALILFRLGIVVRDLGETETADNLIARARALDPAIEA